MMRRGDGKSGRVKGTRFGGFFYALKCIGTVPRLVATLKA